MQWKWLFAILVVLILLGFWMYKYLGGFNDISLQVKNNVKVSLRGEYFEGTYGDRQNRLRVDYYRDLITKDHVKGYFSVIHYSRSGQNNDSIHQFIGIHLQDTSQTQIPDTLIQKNLNPSKVIEATITNHALLRPSPEDVKTKVAKFARSRELNLADYSIEKYIDPRKLVILYPVKE